MRSLHRRFILCSNSQIYGGDFAKFCGLLRKYELYVEKQDKQTRIWQQALFSPWAQRYTYRVLQTIQMKLILLCVWAEPAVLGSTKTALKFKYQI